MINRNGRGVRRQNGVLTDQGFHFRQHGGFDFRVLDNRFDDHLRAFDTSVVQRRLNGRQHLCHFQAIQLAAFQLLIEQLGRFAHAQRQ